MRFLNTPGDSTAEDVNNRGHVVGTFNDAATVPHAFLFNGVQLIQLDGLPEALALVDGEGSCDHARWSARCRSGQPRLDADHPSVFAQRAVPQGHPGEPLVAVSKYLRAFGDRLLVQAAECGWVGGSGVDAVSILPRRGVEPALAGSLKSALVGESQQIRELAQ